MKQQKTNKGIIVNWMTFQCAEINIKMLAKVSKNMTRETYAVLKH